MTNNVSSTNTAVATLMYHCGVSVDMNYGVSGSGSYSWYVPNALINYFAYQNTAEIKFMADFTTTNWISMLKAELDASRPVQYSGIDGSFGHAFVCDGYNSSNQFHFNWGWSGSSNGYYAIGSLNPSGYSFNQNNMAVVRIKPPSNAPVANFTASTITPPVGGSVIFSDASTNTPTSWSWTFDGGNPSTSTQTNPQNITYATAGQYQVSLTVTNANGTDTKVRTQYINVGGTPSAWTKQNTGFSVASRGIDQIFIVNPYVVWAKAYDGSGSAANVREFTRTINGGITWTPGTITFTNSANYGVSNIFAINDSVCYACMFPYPTSGTGGKIVKTTNRGTTWTEQTTAPFTGSWADFVHFFDVNNGVAVGDPIGSEYVIYTTSNGGNSWTQVPGANMDSCIHRLGSLKLYYRCI
jgi:PKD repeat protein